MGDEVLKAVAARMKCLLRDLDILCRWSGEEFLRQGRDRIESAAA